MGGRGASGASGSSGGLKNNSGFSFSINGKSYNVFKNKAGVTMIQGSGSDFSPVKNRDIGIKGQLAKDPKSVIEFAKKNGSYKKFTSKDYSNYSKDRRDKNIAQGDLELGTSGRNAGKFKGLKNSTRGRRKSIIR